MPKGQYKHLCEGERRVIAHMKRSNFSLRAIARATGRAPSTIMREIKRNLHHNADHDYYTYSIAQSKANGRTVTARRHSYFSDAEWSLVEGHIRNDWSPDQTAKTLSKEGKLSISHEAIYQHIYKDKKAGGTLYEHLRHRCRKKRKRYRSKDSRGRLAGKLMIQARPDDINTRSSVGHWEIDTVMGKGAKACIVTIVERKTGFVYIGLLQERTVKEVNKHVVHIINKSPYPFHSITSDNGTEFHGYKEIEKMTGVTFYFATPHHAWERGTNENTNGLIRQYLPKGQSMKWAKQNTCEIIAQRLNERPRLRLLYSTPKKEIEKATRVALGG